MQYCLELTERFFFLISFLICDGPYAEARWYIHVPPVTKNQIVMGMERYRDGPKMSLLKNSRMSSHWIFGYLICLVKRQKKEFLFWHQNFVVWNTCWILFTFAGYSSRLLTQGMPLLTINESSLDVSVFRLHMLMFHDAAAKCQKYSYRISEMSFKNLSFYHRPQESD